MCVCTFIFLICKFIYIYIYLYLYRHDPVVHCCPESQQCHPLNIPPKISHILGLPLANLLFVYASCGPL